MAEAQQLGGGSEPALTRHWLRWVAVIWLGTAIFLIVTRWMQIQLFALGDTDDNLRIAQVRALLGGQDWFDLRQYRLNPPEGLDIHWSRLVDLPIAGIILVLKPLFGGAIAEKWAVAVAPILPLFVALAGVGAAARRLIAPGAFLMAAAVLLTAPALLPMFVPLRIDHHGWQLAMLALIVAGVVDDKPARGGLTVGLASAVSLTIGLELAPYLALGGAAIVLRWVWLEPAGTRLRSYALSLSGGAALGYALFASYANRAPACDALSPVWLSAALAGSALLFAVSLLSTGRWQVRIAAAGAAGVVLALAFALSWPDCLGRPEQVSEELDRLWLSNIREAKPVYEHKLTTVIRMSLLPLIGLVGGGWALWRARRTPLLAGWAAVVVMLAFACAMLLWQTRVGPAAQVLAVPGAAALGWALIGWFRRQQRPIVRILGVVGSFILVSGLSSTYAAQLVPEDKPGPRMKQVNRAGARCGRLSSLRPIARLPERETIMTMVDLGPRIVATTKHNALAGPYHRNERAILDMHHAWGGTPEKARAIADAHGATMLLICPHFPEGTVYRARNPKGFYARLERGERFDWLEPVALPKDSPYRLYRVR